jgi:predicted transcriptional regulator
MGTQQTGDLGLPPKLQAEVEKIAKAQDRTVNEVLAEAVDRYVKEKQWANLKSYGRQKAKERGIGEGDVDRLIEESRRDQGRY